MVAANILADRQLLDALVPFHLVWLKSGKLSQISTRASHYFGHDLNESTPDELTVYLYRPYQAKCTTEQFESLCTYDVLIGATPDKKNALIGRFIKIETSGCWIFSGFPEQNTEQAESRLGLENTLGELKRTQATLVQQERLKAVGEMVGGIAHDFSNILTPISAYSWLIQSSPNLSDRERHEYLDLIITATKDAHALIERLRRLYNPAHSSASYSSFDLNGVIEETLRLARPRWTPSFDSQSKSIKIVRDLMADGEMTGVESDIRQAILNLLYNASDAIPDDGVITVSTTSDPSRIWVSIRDDGRGMKPETLDQCANPFFTTKGENGTGLGLPMVFETAVRHGGDVRIESSLDEGTRVTLCLPRQPLDNGSGEIHATSTALAARLITRVGLDSDRLGSDETTADIELKLSDSDILDALFEAALDPNMATQEVVYPPGAFTLEQTTSTQVHDTLHESTIDVPGPSSQLSTKPLDILVVDDDETILNVLCRIIQTKGHRSHKATQSSAALLMIEQTVFDIAICDLNMPGMTGDQLCLALKKKTPSTKVIMYTGNPNGICPDAANVIDAVISKPSPPADVIKRGLELVHSQTQ